MNTVLSKTLSYFFLTIAILWYSVFFLLVLIYAIGVFKQETGVFYALRRIADDWDSTINIIITIVLLLPGIGAYQLYQYFDPNKKPTHD